MILQSHAQYRLAARPGPGASRVRIGVLMLGAVVAVLTLLNVLAGAA